MRDHWYASKVAGLLEKYFSFMGYPDAWVLGVAEDFLRHGAWSLAREALEVFEYERAWSGLAADAMQYFSKLLDNEELVCYSGEYVELQELADEEIPL